MSDRDKLQKGGEVARRSDNSYQEGGQLGGQGQCRFALFISDETGSNAQQTVPPLGCNMPQRRGQGHFKTIFSAIVMVFGVVSSKGNVIPPLPPPPLSL